MAIDIRPRSTWADRAAASPSGHVLALPLIHGEGLDGTTALRIVRDQIAAPAQPAQGREWAPWKGGVFIHHMGSMSFSPNSEAECIEGVADVWGQHMRKDYGDIAYNFLVCPHGKIYEGRGLVRGEANGGDAPATSRTKQGEIWVNGTGAVGRNAGFYSILGMIKSWDQPTQAMLNSIKNLIGYLQGDVSSHIRAGANIFPHSHGDNTECPGNLTPYAKLGSVIDPGRPAPSPVVSIVPRVAWGARPPRGESSVPLSQRTGFAVHYSAGPATQSVRSIQNYHMDGRNWPDIGYNFLVDRFGRVYEGRGWLSIGAHATGYNTTHIGVCFIGSNGDATPAAKNAIRALYYAANHNAGRTLQATYHGAIGSTACPGADLRNWVISGLAGDNVPIEGGGPPGAGAGVTHVRSVSAQQHAVNLLGHTPLLVVDGSFGPATLAGVRWLQRKVGVEADGNWGPLTEAAYVAHIGGGTGGGLTLYRSVKAQQRAANALGYTPALVVDGSFGPATTAGVRWLQTKIGVEADGNWGPATEKAYLAHTGQGSSSGGISTIRSVSYQQNAVNGLGYTPALVVDGAFGPLTLAGVRWLQTKIGVDADGNWGPNTEAAYGRWSDGERLVVDGSFGPATISATQRAIGVVPDGVWGPESKRALQRHLNTWSDAGLVVDGAIGPGTVKALQNHLNKMIRAGLPLDGSWGPATNRALQTALNLEKF
ncbi:peptidoglycan recognition protein family protein [Streptomyces albipurpureus]|uniref:Peptidoglycan-binding protein n=1 Tax=Streptomyces albipurpureus TaxID=2897419 RepID=A0ABT0UH18_9ACTN|nr:peptidoglycan-binding protein [Streptomyces sp. CWNU-1]MCM2387735.1 peptidoglycan-binding protein [Streptomyces sp. CWNU-1]